MVDVHTKEQRSRNMSRIRGKWTKQETLFHNFLKGHKIRHKMHPKLSGNPDIYLPENNAVIFLDGCFWHGCPKCYKKPASNIEYWENKRISNLKNDRKVNRILKKEGYKVVRTWECEIKRDLGKVLNKIISKG